MKRVELERQAIVRALDEAPNITAASHKLGASRRTLQSRMRDYGIPKGESGRPRELLPYRSSASLLPGLVVVGVVGLGCWLLLSHKFYSKSKTTISGDNTKNPYLIGADILAAS